MFKSPSVGVGDPEDVAEEPPSRPKLPPVPAHLRRLLKPSSGNHSAHTSRQASLQTGPDPAATSCAAPFGAQQPAAELHAAILRQAAMLKPLPFPPAQACKQVISALTSTHLCLRCSCMARSAWMTCLLPSDNPSMLWGPRKKSSAPMSHAILSMPRSSQAHGLLKRTTAAALCRHRRWEHRRTLSGVARSTQRLPSRLPRHLCPPRHTSRQAQCSFATVPPPGLHGRMTSDEVCLQSWRSFLRSEIPGR